MGADYFETTVNVVKLIVIFLAMINAVPLLVWVERRGSAFIQHRFGPNRVGPLGLLQLLADAIKFVMKEEFIPKRAESFMYYAAPVAALLPAALALAAIPFSIPIEVQSFIVGNQTYGPYVFQIQGFEMNIGIIFILGVGSLSAYALLMAGWGSSSKFSLMGALRACAQMISYELAMGLAIVAVILIYSTFNLTEMIQFQKGPLSFSFGGVETTIKFLPNWGIFFQPLGFILFFAAVFAESNRLPFDLPEAEGELVVGFHTEYGGFKMLLFFMGEYGHMIVASALLTIFYFGGYSLPFPWISEADVFSFFAGQLESATAASALTSLTFLLSFLFKISIFLWIFIWVRWTLPRFRYDHLMDLGWKTMLPWALANIIITAFVMFIGRQN